jgi:hypothetical protein
MWTFSETQKPYLHLLTVLNEGSVNLSLWQVYRYNKYKQSFSRLSTFLLIGNSFLRVSDLCGHLQASLFIKLKSTQLCSATLSWGRPFLFTYLYIVEFRHD